MRRGEPRPDTDSHNGGEQDTVAQAGMVLMDQSFQTLGMDSGAVSIFRALSRKHKRIVDAAAECPPALAEEVRELMLRARRAGSASSVVHLPLGEFAYTGRTYYLKPQNGFNQPLIVLYLRGNVSAQGALGQTSFEYRLTEREQATLLGMALGLTNKELAQRMSISTGTAKTFVRLVMAKMGVARRAAVVAKVLEHMI